MNDVEPGDIVQLDPASDIGKEWGPQLCTVTETKQWGIVCYFIHADRRGDFGPAYLRLKRGSYERVGRAMWAVKRIDD